MIFSLLKAKQMSPEFKFSMSGIKQMELGALVSDWTTVYRTLIAHSLLFSIKIFTISSLNSKNLAAAEKHSVL